MNFIKLAWKNLTARPLSMVLTLVLFALGVGLTSLLLLVNQQLTDKFEKNLAGVNVVMGAKGSPLQMILCNMYHVDAPTGNISLKTAKPFLNPLHPFFKQSVPLSLGDSYKGYRIVGTIKDFTKLYSGEISEGKLWDAPLETTLGATVAQKTGLKLGDTFASNHGLNTEGDEHDHAKFKVVGIFKPSNTVLDQLVVTATQSIWAVHEHAEEMATEKKEHDEKEHDEHDEKHENVPPSVLEGEIGEKQEENQRINPPLQAGDDRTALINEIDTTKQITSVLLQFKNNKSVQALNFQRNINQNTDMQAATPAIELNRLFEMMGVGEKALRSLAFLIVFVSGLSIFIALFNSLKERQYELALMRVMGAGRHTLFILIVAEGLLLSFIGFLAGILLSHTAMQLLARYMSDAYRYSFTGWTWLSEEWWLLVGALAIGFVAAIVPAFNAYRTDISKTLSKS
jgi:putative ABC transport system permease protein